MILICVTSPCCFNFSRAGCNVFGPQESASTKTAMDGVMGGVETFGGSAVLGVESLGGGDVCVCLDSEGVRRFFKTMNSFTT